MKSLYSMGLKYEGQLLVLDQTKLPHEEHWITVRSPDEMIVCIRRLSVRGAPLIGVAAALALAQYAENGATPGEIRRAGQLLKESRPTAVNLMAAIDRLTPMAEAPELLVRTAVQIFEEDVALCESMAARGAELIADGDGVLTHCNSGALATAGLGTALGVIRRAFDQGKKIHVFVDETRPLLQGARLTAWELSKLKIPFTLICDNMAGSLMAQGKIQKIFIGADRIARNGDVANKIGSYSLAVLAKHHKIPFYVVAPQTTFDANCPSGDKIPIEARDPEEVRAGRSPAACDAWNPAFDVTPRELITAIVRDDSILPKNH